MRGRHATESVRWATTCVQHPFLRGPHSYDNETSRAAGRGYHDDDGRRKVSPLQDQPKTPVASPGLQNMVTLRDDHATRHPPEGHIARRLAHQPTRFPRSAAPAASIPHGQEGQRAGDDGVSITEKTAEKVAKKADEKAIEKTTEAGVY